MSLPIESAAPTSSYRIQTRSNGLHAEIKRRTNVVVVFPNEDSITRLFSAVFLEQNDEWAVSRRYITLESIAHGSNNLTVKLPAVAA